MDGLLSIQYRNKLNEDAEADVYLPDYPTLTGESFSLFIELNLTVLLQAIVITPMMRH